MPLKKILKSHRCLEVKIFKFKIFKFIRLYIFLLYTINVVNILFMFFPSQNFL